MDWLLRLVVSEGEFEAYEGAAQAAGLEVAAWVRKALRVAVRSSPPPSNPNQKLAAIRRAARYRFPASETDQMVAEVQSR